MFAVMFGIAKLHSSSFGWLQGRLISQVVVCTVGDSCDCHGRSNPSCCRFLSAMVAPLSVTPSSSLTSLLSKRRKFEEVFGSGFGSFWNHVLEMRAPWAVDGPVAQSSQGNNMVPLAFFSDGARFSRNKSLLMATFSSIVQKGPTLKSKLLITAIHKDAEHVPEIKKAVLGAVRYSFAAMLDGRWSMPQSARWSDFSQPVPKQFTFQLCFVDPALVVIQPMWKNADQHSLVCKSVGCEPPGQPQARQRSERTASRRTPACQSWPAYCPGSQVCVGALSRV